MLRPVHRFVRRGAAEDAVGEPVQPLDTSWAAAAELQRAVCDTVLRRCDEANST